MVNGRMDDFLRPFLWLRHVGNVSIPGHEKLLRDDVNEVDTVVKLIKEIKLDNDDRPNLELIYDAVRRGLLELGRTGQSPPGRWESMDLDDLEIEFSNKDEQTCFKLDGDLRGIPSWSYPAMLKMQQAAEADDTETFFALRDSILVKAKEKVTNLHRLQLEYA